MTKLDIDFFSRDCLQVAPGLVGKIIAHKIDGEILRLRVTETEAYRGCEDSACHAYRGKTERNKLLWEKPGTVYVYLCYGIHWLLNAITGSEGQPQGVLIRACEGYGGPGKLTKRLQIDKTLNGDSFVTSERIWFEDDGLHPEICTAKRVGIGYATQEDQDRLWRFIMKEN